MSQHDQLQAILADWPHWHLAREPQVVDTFTAGLNHHTVLLQAGTRQLVLKQFAAPQPGAVAAQLWAAELGLAPAVLHAPADHRYLLMEAIQAPDLRTGSVDARLLGGALNRLHNAPSQSLAVSLGDFDLVRFCRQYLGGAGVLAGQLHAQLIPVLQHFLADPTPWCMCHNDLVEANCFIVAGRAQFIDWEYARNHNPWFDLAAIVYYLKLDRAAAQALLGAWQTGWETKVDEPIFLSAQIALLWGDMLWHLNKFGSDYWDEMSGKKQDLLRLTTDFGIELNV